MIIKLKKKSLPLFSDTHFFLLRRSLSAGPRVPVLLIPIGSPEASSSEGVDAGHRKVKGHIQNKRQFQNEHLKYV